ncbi:MAG: hypothetical protein NTY13_01620 [Chlamydiae bacterium]|nr:hypothetical protein [Chlamydiota bacterium]
MNDRQRAILDCIRKHPISDQQMLVTLLEIAGFSTNQVTISRDLRRLGIIKKEIKGRQIYEISSSNINEELLKMAVINISYNENLIAITTRQGLAPFIGDYIDALKTIPLLGCISGENMIFVAPKSVKDLPLIVEKLKEALFVKKILH